MHYSDIDSEKNKTFRNFKYTGKGVDLFSCVYTTFIGLFEESSYF